MHHLFELNATAVFFFFYVWSMLVHLPFVHVLLSFCFEFNASAIYLLHACIIKGLIPNSMLRLFTFLFFFYLFVCVSYLTYYIHIHVLYTHLTCVCVCVFFFSCCSRRKYVHGTVVFLFFVLHGGSPYMAPL